MRYRVTHRSAAARPGLTQVLGRMNNQLNNLLPNLSNSLAIALREEGHTTLANKLGSTVVDTYTYDSDTDVGYVYLVQSQPVLQGETPAFSTICFATPDCIIDLRKSGDIFGIELLSLTPEFKEFARQE